jgi:hypothetical protein
MVERSLAFKSHSIQISKGLSDFCDKKSEYIARSIFIELMMIHLINRNSYELII